jgi:hypothetical protein
MLSAQPGVNRYDVPELSLGNRYPVAGSRNLSSEYSQNPDPVGDGRIPRSESGFRAKRSAVTPSNRSVRSEFIYLAGRCTGSGVRDKLLGSLPFVLNCLPWQTHQGFRFINSSQIFAESQKLFDPDVRARHVKSMNPRQANLEMNAALAAEGTTFLQERLFPQPINPPYSVADPA